MKKKCPDCIHYRACGMWVGGPMDHTLAEKCVNFETWNNCFAYYRGFNDGTDAVTNYIKAKKNQENLRGKTFGI